MAYKSNGEKYYNSEDFTVKSFDGKYMCLLNDFDNSEINVYKIQQRISKKNLDNNKVKVPCFEIFSILIGRWYSSLENHISNY